jgi:hypothetical protein
MPGWRSRTCAGAGVAGAFFVGWLSRGGLGLPASGCVGFRGHGIFVMRGIRTLEARVRLELSDVTRIGRDVCLIYRPGDLQ